MFWFYMIFTFIAGGVVGAGAVTIYLCQDMPDSRMVKRLRKDVGLKVRE